MIKVIWKSFVEGIIHKLKAITAEIYWIAC